MSTVVVPLGPASVDITGVRAGDVNRIAITLSAEGQPLDLAGVTIKAQARVTPLAEEALEAVIEIVDAAKGQIILRWPGADVTTMLAGKTTWKGVWDLQLTAAPDDPMTVAAGKFTAVMDVTRT